MKKIVGISMGALAIALFANTASAQLGYMPVITSPGGYQGLNIAAGIGMGLSDDTKGIKADGTESQGMAFGGMVGFGAKMFNINAGVSSVDTKIDGAKKPLSFGGNVGVTVFQPAESPLAINVFGGFGMWDLKDEATSTSQLKATNIPFGVGIGFAPPMTGSVGFEVWAAPRGQMLSTKIAGGDSESQFGFGVSAGVNVNFAMGFGIYAAIDWSTFSEKTDDAGAVVRGEYKPMFVGAGLKYNFKTPGAGM
jgi:opacity protein-like surface antigen